MLIVFPARAGMSRCSFLTRRRSWSVPRASGDEPQLVAFIARESKCSPRERG